MNADNNTLGDWNEHGRLVLSDLKQLKKDVYVLSENQRSATLKISTEIATLRTAINSQKRAWWIVAGAVPPLIFLLLQKFLS
jgi:hypothetical protein